MDRIKLSIYRFLVKVTMSKVFCHFVPREINGNGSFLDFDNKYAMKYRMLVYDYIDYVYGIQALGGSDVQFELKHSYGNMYQKVPILTELTKSPKN